MKHKQKILLTRRLHSFALKELKRKYDVTIHSGKIPIPKKMLMKKIQDKDGLICFPYDIIDSPESVEKKINKAAVLSESSERPVALLITRDLMVE